MTDQITTPAVPNTNAVRILYKKPRLSGYVENNYTFSLTTSQFQDNNIRNFGVAAALGISTRTISAAVSAGYSSGEDKMKKGNTSTRKIYMSGSFNVPKVEIYLDTTQACASKEFTDAITKALEPADDWEKTKQLFNTLSLFGQFVPTRYVLGGKLTTSEVKELKVEESAESKTDEFAWKVKAKVSVDTIAVGVQAEASANREGKDRSQKAAGDEKEVQSMVMNAIGGEGILVSDTSKWATSLGRYHNWSVIAMSDLVPSVNLLPEELSNKCHELLKKWVDNRDVEEILAPKSFFLICDGYYDRYKSKPYFCIKNDKTLQALTLEDADMHDGMKVTMEESDTEITRQHWCFTPEGYIVHKKKMGIAEFALTYNSETQTIETALKGSADNQYWELLPTKQLYNLSQGKYLSLDDKNNLVLKPKNNTDVKQLWVTEGFGEGRAKKYYCLQWNQTNEVMTMIDGNRQVLGINPDNNNYSLDLHQFIGIDNQLWEYVDGKLLISKFRSKSGQRFYLHKTRGGTGITAVTKPSEFTDEFYWRINDEGLMYSHGDRDRLVFKPVNEDFSEVAGGNFTPAERKKQKWAIKRIDVGPVPQTFKQLTSNNQNFIPLGTDIQIYTGKLELEMPITGFKWSMEGIGHIKIITLHAKSGDKWHAIQNTLKDFANKDIYNRFSGMLADAIIVGRDNVIIGVEVMETNRVIWFALKVRDKNNKEFWVKQNRIGSILQPIHINTDPVEAGDNETIAAVELYTQTGNGESIRLHVSETR